MSDALITARPGLSRPVRVDELAAAVAGERSWRGVLRRLGFTTSRTAQVLREVCDEHGIDYAHFRQITPDDRTLRAVIPVVHTWPEALERLGYAPGSGSARATVRKHCRRLGLDTAHLRLNPVANVDPPCVAPKPEHLRSAGPHLVAAALTLAGHEVCPAPEGVAYDLVVNFADEGFRRIQVKTTTCRSGSTWACSLTRTRYQSRAPGHGKATYSTEDIDFFACVTGDGDVYLIPISAVEGLAVIHLRRYAAFLIPPLGRADRT